MREHSSSTSISRKVRKVNSTWKFSILSTYVCKKKLNCLDYLWIKKTTFFPIVILDVLFQWISWKVMRQKKSPLVSYDLSLFIEQSLSTSDRHSTWHHRGWPKGAAQVYVSWRGSGLRGEIAGLFKDCRDAPGNKIKELFLWDRKKSSEWFHILHFYSDWKKVNQ